MAIMWLRRLKDGRGCDPGASWTNKPERRIHDTVYIENRYC